MIKPMNERVLGVQRRFFEALDLAIRLGRYNSLQDFCTTNGLNRPKYSRIRSAMSNGSVDGSLYKLIDIDALTAICLGFGVSADWLLTGRGKMMKDDSK